MSDSGEDGVSPGAKRFDVVSRPWFFPLLLVCPLILLRCLFPSQLERPELSWLDSALRVREQLKHDEPMDPRIRFLQIQIDDEIARRYATDGEYATAADILKTLASLGVKVIALDIHYTHGIEEDQILLAKAIEEIGQEHDTTVVLAMAIEDKIPTPKIVRSLPLSNLGGLLEGFVNAVADDHWREYRLVREFQGETHASLALAAFAASRPGPLRPKVAAPGVFEWKELSEDGGIETKFASTERLFLNLQQSYYTNRADKEAGFGIRSWSISRIEELAETLSERGEMMNSPLVDTIFFYGSSAEVDQVPTTHGDMEPGMLIHGTALNDLLRGIAIRPAPIWLDILIFCLVAALASLTFSIMHRKRSLLMIASVVFLLLLAAGWAGIWYFYLLIPSISASLLWGLSVVFEIGRRWAWEQRERTHRDAMLGFYFSPAVLKQVTKDLDMIRPQANEVSVLLSDLRGFTTLCETQPVEKVFELLNRLFGVETEIALRENGSLSRFAGDQFLAYWGAPEPFDDAPDRALRAAVDIQRTLIARRTAADEDNLDAWLRIGVGLHCGRGLVGHVGSRSYRDYNIVGDTVNTTARVEGQTKNYDAPVLATGEFLAALSETPPNLHVDCVIVKGKANPTDLHAILLEPTEEILAGCEKYEAAFSLYQEGRFEEAVAAFRPLLSNHFPTIATSAELLTARCRDLIESPPAGWNGVFELTSK